MMIIYRILCMLGISETRCLVHTRVAMFTTFLRLRGCYGYEVLGY